MAIEVAKMMQDEVNEKSVLDFMRLCLMYDMEFYYETQAKDMYILHKSLRDEEYVQILFDKEKGEMIEAYMDWDGGIIEFSGEQHFYRILEEVRKDFLHQIYAEYGLIEHPRNRLKRRGDCSKVIECLQYACNSHCTMEYSSNIILIEATRKDLEKYRIAITVERGKYKCGALRRGGITINIPDHKSMIMILKELES